MPLKSGGAVENEYTRGRVTLGLGSVGKAPMFLYAGLWRLVDSDIYMGITKVDLPTFKRVSGLNLELADTEYEVSALATSGNYLYAGLTTTPGKVVKVDLSTFSVVDSLTFDGYAGVYALIVVGNYLYAGVAGLWPEPGEIAKIDLSTFSVVATLPTYAYSTMSFAVSGNYLYFSWAHEAISVAKIDLSTFESVADNMLTSFALYVGGSAVSGDYLYVSGYSAYFHVGWIFKVVLETLEVVGDRLDTYPSSALPLVASGDFLYAAAGSTYADGSCKIVKINLSTFEAVDEEDIGFPWGYVSSLVIFGNFLYCGLLDYPCGIIKVDLTTFDIISSLMFPEDEAYVSSLAI